MKTKLLLAVTVAFAFTGFARAEDKPSPAAAEVDYKQLGFDNNLITWEGKPFSGVAIKKDKQGRKRGRFLYEGGLLHGLVEEWYTNGAKSVECTFVKNDRHGTNTYWNPDGTLLKRQVWKDGKLVESTDKHDLEAPAP